MLVSLREILCGAEKGGYAVPAFNVYNMETVMGVLHAAEASRSPVIMQIYSRLFDSENGKFAGANILAAAKYATVPVAFHLDHGATEAQVIGALDAGATGIMIDASKLEFDDNVAVTRKIVARCKAAGDIAVEGELGHVGTTKEEIGDNYTEPEAARRFVEKTGVEALAVAVGTAHGRYKKAPKLAIERTREIKKAAGVPLVLHGGSGVPDEEIRAAIGAGIRKVNFSTDLCYSFLDTVFATSREWVGIDLFMRDAVKAVEDFALSKIAVLGSAGQAK
ncbi:MAG: class II fructose-bisphosphate aldolase [Clostridia bacterium]|nr:class II fructose-bisphosphate aldolase [Clostridia bacterium]